MTKSKSRDGTRIPVAAVGPILKPVIRPVVARLDHHEQLLRELKAASDIQLVRIAELQVQLDRLIASLIPKS